MHTLQRLSLCSVCSPAHTFATCASRASPLSAHTPTHGGGHVGYPLSLSAPIPQPQRGKEAISAMPLHCPLAQVCLLRTGEESSAGKGWCAGWDQAWRRLCRARSRTQSNRCKAGTKSGGSHYFGLGHFQSLAVLRVTQRLARSPVALHIPFLSMNEWSNLAGGHCKTQ